MRSTVHASLGKLQVKWKFLGPIRNIGILALIRKPKSGFYVT